MRVTRAGAASVVTRARAASPLKLLTPRNRGGAAWIFTSTYGGGLVDGDAVRLDVDVEASASALLATQASTKIYRNRRGVRSALHARVAADALLVALPDPVVCFAGSRYAQTQTCDLASGASLVFVDWMTSGRRARGERWAFTEYRSRFDLRVSGRLVCRDALTLAAADGDLRERFGRFDVLATVVMAGPRFVEPCRRLVDEASRRPIERRGDRLVSIAPIDGVGTVARVAGRSVEDVGRAIREMLSFLPDVLGDDPWIRKW